MCETCRAEVADLELIGAALMRGAALAPEAGAAAPLPAVDRPADADAAASSRPRRRSQRTGPLPEPLASVFDLSLETIPWRRLGPGVWHHRLPLSPGVEGDLRLLRIGPGRIMPDHGHGGSELTLVLDGAYSDETGAYRRGDLQDVDEAVEHTPVADAQAGCICLIASERPARFKTLVGKLMQPWTGL